MNKLLSKLAISLASFAMVLGGAAMTVYSKEQAKPAYAVEEESIQISDGYVVLLNEDYVFTATPKGFNPSSYTWTSSDENIATVTWVGNTATVHGVSVGYAQITVSAQGTNGIVSKKKTVHVDTFRIESEFDTVRAQPCSDQVIGFEVYNYIYGKNVIVEATSDNPDIVSVSGINSGSQTIVIEIGPYENVSANITISVKDNNGEPGYHTASDSVTVNVDSYYAAGNRVTSLPLEYGEETPIILANGDKTKFVYVDNANDRMLFATDDIRRASLFSINSNGEIKYCYHPSNSANGFCGITDYVNGYHISNGNDGQVIAFGQYFYDVQNWDPTYPPEPLYENYPGILLHNDYYYMAVDSFTNFIEPTSINFLDDYEPVFAYEASAVTERIIPEETTIEIIENASTITNIDTVFVDSLTYEVLDGEECIHSIGISDINSSGTARMYLSVSKVRGTAVVRVKDTNNPDLYYVDITIIVTRNNGMAFSYIHDLQTRAELAYKYTKHEDDSFTFSNMSLRFGAIISEQTWNLIDTDYHDISGFGVMVTANHSYDFGTDYDNVVSAEDEHNIDTDIVDYFMPTSEMAVPPSLDDENYAWNLFLQIDESEIDKEFIAWAYIKVEDEIYRFREARYSVRSLAYDYLWKSTYYPDVADGSLAYLAGW